MKHNSIVIANTLAITVGIFYVSCRILVSLFPELMFSVAQSWFHGIELAKQGIKIPVLMLTAKSTTEDKVAGLDSGADDYLTKPFSFVEFRSRVHALIRRSHHDTSPVLTIDGLEVDSLKHSALRDGKLIKLTPKEFAILELLLRHRGEVISRTMIIEHVWDYNFDGMSNVVDVFVTTLRKKIDSGAKIKLIQTVHGVGYKIGN